MVLPEYSDTWSKAIDNRRDFNIAVNAKKKSYDSMISQASVIYSDMEGQLKTVSEAAKENPDKYEAVDYWASTTQYDLFHTHQLDKYKVLNSTAKIPEQDSAIQRYLSAYPELSFDSTSSFLRGCVSISSK